MARRMVRPRSTVSISARLGRKPESPQPYGGKPQGGPMHRPICVLAASCFALAGAASQAAGEPAQHDAFWKHVQDICNTTSNVKTIDKIEPQAEQVAATAEKEHRLWGGHKVD